MHGAVVVYPCSPATRNAPMKFEKRARYAPPRETLGSHNSI